MSLTFHEYEDRAKSTALYPDRGHNLYYPTLGLSGESGEVAEKIKKIYRDEKGTLTPERRAEIAKELGDVLWYVAALCHEIGVTMEDVARGNLIKLSSRKTRGVINGSGDER